jgi:inhibitor of cysteine peptidase
MYGELMAGKVGVTMPVFMAALILIGLLVALGFSLALPQGTTGSVYGAADNGTTITVNSGSTFTIKLAENPSTGYSWNVSSSPGLTIANSNYIQGASMPGAGGTHEWTLQALVKGQQQFTAVYKRPWEPLVGNESTYALTVNVV